MLCLGRKETGAAVAVDVDAAGVGEKVDGKL